jgi:hypothetical protein
MLSGHYSGLFLDKYGDLPFFLRQNGIEPTPQDEWQWGQFLVEVVRRVSKECGKWGVELYVNGGVEQNYREAITGPMYENIPNESTWKGHFDRIKYDCNHYGRGNVIIGENGPEGKYRRECLALAMLFNGCFAPHTKPSEPLLIGTESETIVGEWLPWADAPITSMADNPRAWQRMFWNPRQHITRECRMTFSPDWRTCDVVLPWDN